MRRSWNLWALVASPVWVLALPILAVAGSFGIPNEFHPGQVANAYAINENFQAIRAGFDDLEIRFRVMEQKVIGNEDDEAQISALQARVDALEVKSTQIQDLATRLSTVEGQALQIAPLLARVAALEAQDLTFKAQLDGFLANGGIVKAACHIDGGSSPVVTRQFSNLPGTPKITVWSEGRGAYIVEFGANLTGSHYMVVQGNKANGVPVGGPVDVTPRWNDQNALYVRLFDTNGALVDTNFYVVVF